MQLVMVYYMVARRNDVLYAVLYAVLVSMMLN